MGGTNHEGQLGNGTTTNSSVPIKITLPESVMQTAVYGIAPVALQSTGETASSASESGFDGLLPNTVYNFYIMKSCSAENALSKENLFYLDQGVTDENGNISFKYTDKAELDGAEKFVTEYKNALPDSVIGSTVIAAETNRLVFKAVGSDLSGYEGLFARFTVGMKSCDIAEYTSLPDGGMQFVCDIATGLPDNAIIEVRLFASAGGIQYRSAADINLLISARCDIDKNGTVNSVDLIKMRNALLSGDTLVCDTDGNETTDILDMVHLKKHLAGII